jgi:hypothetical protein
MTAPGGATWKYRPVSAILSGMAQSPQPYDLVTRPCTIHAGRFRWDIRQNGRPVQSSMESFASEQEAHMDGRLELEKLMRLDR